MSAEHAARIRAAATGYELNRAAELVATDPAITPADRELLQVLFAGRCRSVCHPSSTRAGRAAPKTAAGAGANR